MYVCVVDSSVSTSLECVSVRVSVSKTRRERKRERMRERERDKSKGNIYEILLQAGNTHAHLSAKNIKKRRIYTYKHK